MLPVQCLVQRQIAPLSSRCICFEQCEVCACAVALHCCSSTCTYVTNGHHHCKKHHHLMHEMHNAKCAVHPRYMQSRRFNVPVDFTATLPCNYASMHAYYCRSFATVTNTQSHCTLLPPLYRAGKHTNSQLKLSWCQASSITPCKSILPRIVSLRHVPSVIVYFVIPT